MCFYDNRHETLSGITQFRNIWEGAAIFTDMTETILDALDQQMAMSSDIQKPEGTPIGKDMTNK